MRAPNSAAQALASLRKPSFAREAKGAAKLRPVTGRGEYAATHAVARREDDK